MPSTSRLSASDSKNFDFKKKLEMTLLNSYDFDHIRIMCLSHSGVWMCFYVIFHGVYMFWFFRHIAFSQSLKLSRFLCLCWFVADHSNYLHLPLALFIPNKLLMPLQAMGNTSPCLHVPIFFCAIVLLTEAANSKTFVRLREYKCMSVSCIITEWEN